MPCHVFKLRPAEVVRHGQPCANSVSELMLVVLEAAKGGKDTPGGLASAGSNGVLHILGHGMVFMAVCIETFSRATWGFPKIGDPNIAPSIVGSLL